MPEIIITDQDNLRREFQATMDRVGSGLAQRAFRLALNKEGRKTFTQVKRALVKQTSIKYGTINQAMTFKASANNDLSIVIRGKGRHISTKEFGARQTKKGVRAKVWGKTQTYPGTFIVQILGGHVFHRTSDERFPIKKHWGPSIPVEMVKDESVETFNASGPVILAEATRVLGLIMDGTIKAPPSGG